jgi:hypothetical protein
MTAGMFHVTKLTPPGSECNPTPWRLLAKCEVYQTCVSLLSTRDSSLLASILVTLCTHAAASDECAALIARLDCVDQLLLMLREYDAPFKHLAADLLQLLCRLRDARKEVHRLGGIMVVTSLLHLPDGAVLEALLRVMCGLLSEVGLSLPGVIRVLVTWTIIYWLSSIRVLTATQRGEKCQPYSEGAAAAEMRAVGGVPILVSMLVGAGGGDGAAGGGGAVASPAVTCLVCSVGLCTI